MYHVAVHNFRRLLVWQQARALAVELHSVVRAFPKSDRGVVGAQLRRAALSISANIAEGCGKSSRRETIRFLEIALGSASETEHHLIIATDLGYLTSSAGQELTGRVIAIERMLRALIKNLPP